MNNHWKYEPLGSIAKTTSGGTPNKKNKEYYGGTIPWVRSGELNNGIIYDSEIKITKEGLKNSSAKIFPRGTLLIALYGATIGKLSFLGIPAATNQAICAIFENEKVTLNYLYYFLLLKRPELIKQGIGGAQPNISQTILKKIIVPYPVSKTEQEKIVSQIEESFSQLDSAVETLNKTKQQLEIYRQAVLKEAFDTAISDCRMMSIGDLLTTERKGMTTGPFGTLIKKSDYLTSGVPMLGIENIGRGQFIAGNRIFVSDEKAKELSSFQVSEGDLIISRSGTVGEICPIPKQAKGSLLSTNLIRITLNNRIILNDYFIALFQSKGIVLDQIKELCKGSTRIFLNQSILKRISFPVPTLFKQKRIVDVLSARTEAIKPIETTIDQSLQQAEALRQSILKQAFSMMD